MTETYGSSASQTNAKSDMDEVLVHVGYTPSEWLIKGKQNSGDSDTSGGEIQSKLHPTEESLGKRRRICCIYHTSCCCPSHGAKAVDYIFWDIGHHIIKIDCRHMTLVCTQVALKRDADNWLIAGASDPYK